MKSFQHCPYTVTLSTLALANLASNHSMDSSFDSPYSLEARSKGFDVPFWKKILGMKLTGGKLDDITVIVGQVVTSPSTGISDEIPKTEVQGTDGVWST